MGIMHCAQLFIIIFAKTCHIGGTCNLKYSCNSKVAFNLNDFVFNGEKDIHLTSQITFFSLCLRFSCNQVCFQSIVVVIHRSPIFIGYTHP